MPILLQASNLDSFVFIIPLIMGVWLVVAWCEAGLPRSRRRR